MFGISLFSWLDKIPFWVDIPYPTRGALLRAFKAALSAGVGILIVAAAQGILFPATWSPMVVLITTTVLQSVDKFLRETEIRETLTLQEAAISDIPPTT